MLYASTPAVTGPGAKSLVRWEITTKLPGASRRASGGDDPGRVVGVRDQVQDPDQHAPTGWPKSSTARTRPAQNILRVPEVSVEVGATRTF